MDNSILVYTDGSCDNKRAKEGGIGIVIRMLDKDGILHKKDHSEGKYLNVTSARMEVMAIKRALELIQPTREHKIIIFSDNQYAVNTIEKGWLNKWIANCEHDRAHFDLWQSIKELIEKHGGSDVVSLKWVRGHNGHNENELADQLANEGRLNNEIIK